MAALNGTAKLVGIGVAIALAAGGSVWTVARISANVETNTTAIDKGSKERARMVRQVSEINANVKVLLERTKGR